ncbi:cupin domain-containing protein [Photobacterium sp. WH77]|uniref:cupin domain-containing protein n=1 Tax=unclassified Photobacterium TaxID=2628852 RepID=UPI001C4933B1|nr:MULTISPECIES: cupin domain-containing protein [unclassified Photobacterium]MBV7262653.1 cupin domain-containing protein [Photobacterium sp. WH24]MCG2837782.1 cupin domain-containing protein [Photobacterium sp. WH77]MCG2845398.1 cupin domain-containing protein [Photobacterium sp. WH80]MDO6582180.1 cupin domain-containing protein [Photobacterium sp. 2_MG-2023]
METAVSTIEKYIRRNTAAEFTDEYNCKLRRLFPWDNKVNTRRPLTEFGCIWVVVEPGKDVDRHSHDEEEAFIVLSGECQLEINGEHTHISQGDVVYIPRHSEHQLRNRSSASPFVMIDIYWDMGGQSDVTL